MIKNNNAAPVEKSVHSTSTHRPRLRQWEKGGYAAEQPYMPMLGPLSLSRLL